MTTRSLVLTPSEYDEFVRTPYADESVGGEGGVALVVVTGSPAQMASPGALPVVVAALTGDGRSGPREADVVVTETTLETVRAQVAANPIAATSLAVLLRSAPWADVEAGLAAESAVYSTLQAGPEFAAWRAQAPHTPDGSDHPTVTVHRDGDVLHIGLDRPDRHNSISTRLRDELTAALQLAALDDSLKDRTSVV